MRKEGREMGRGAAERPPLPPMLWVVCVLIVNAQGIVLDFGVLGGRDPAEGRKTSGTGEKKKEGRPIYTHTTNTLCFCFWLAFVLVCAFFFHFCLVLLPFLSLPFSSREKARDTPTRRQTGMCFFSNTQEVHPCAVLPNVVVVFLQLLLFKQKSTLSALLTLPPPPPRPPHL